VRFELKVLHCPISAIHIAQDPRFHPKSNAYNDTRLPSFRSVTVIHSNTAFDFMDLDMLDGAPYLITVQGRTILFKNLLSGIVRRIRVGALFGYEEEASQNHPDVSFYPTSSHSSIFLVRRLCRATTGDINVRHPRHSHSCLSTGAFGYTRRPK
jgi:hypothetical protein